jgi:hypothetical protein
VHDAGARRDAALEALRFSRATLEELRLELRIVWEPREQ